MLTLQESEEQRFLEHWCSCLCQQQSFQSLLSDYIVKQRINEMRPAQPLAEEDEETPIQHEPHTMFSHQVLVLA